MDPQPGLQEAKLGCVMVLVDPWGERGMSETIVEGRCEGMMIIATFNVNASYLVGNVRARVCLRETAVDPKPAGQFSPMQSFNKSV